MTSMENLVLVNIRESPSSLSAILDDYLEAEHGSEQALLSRKKEDIENALSLGYLKAVAALLDGEVAGFLALSEWEKVLSVNHLFVRQDYRGRGIGIRLAEAARAYFCNCSWLDTMACLIYPLTSDCPFEALEKTGFSLYKRFLMECSLQSSPRLPPRPSGFSIVPLEESHLPALADVLCRTNCRNVDNDLRPGVFSTPRSCRAFLDQILSGFFGTCDYSLCFTALFDGTPQGALLGSLRMGQEPFIPAIFVDPLFQGKGAGWHLLMAALSTFHSRGSSTVSLCVTALNQKACKLYADNGFLIRSTYYEAICTRPACATSPP